MTKFNTGAFTDSTTQSEASGQLELKVGDTATPREIATGSQYATGSVPSGLPVEVEAEGYGYVFRVGRNPPTETVTIKLDTKQLVEQARVRRVNQAIRRALRR